MVETLQDAELELLPPAEHIPGFNVEEVIVAGVRGPCGGVNMAVETTFEVLGIVAGRERVYSNNDPVHNDLLTAEFRELGLEVQPNIKFIPDGSILIASAHGWPPEDQELARKKNLLVIDVTCQLVDKVGRAAERAVNDGKHVLYVGSKGHPEPRGILGRLPKGSYTFIDAKKEVPAPRLTTPLIIFGENGGQGVLRANAADLVVFNQTTLSTKGVTEKVQQLRAVNPHTDIPDPEGICYATGNRQKEVRNRLGDKQSKVDALFAVGSARSHNTFELQQVGEIEAKIPSYRINAPEEIRPEWLTPDIKRIMITSGASVLDPYLLRVISYFTAQGARLTFLPNTEKRPRVNPETGEPFINPETGETEYEERFFVGPDLRPLWQRMAEKYGVGANI